VGRFSGLCHTGIYNASRDERFQDSLWNAKLFINIVISRLLRWQNIPRFKMIIVYTTLKYE